MINFYHRFIPQVASLLVPLHCALQKSTSRHVLSWTAEMDNAFTSIKAALSETTMLSHPEPEAHISLTYDASEQAVGAVLEQYVQGVWQPLAFFSKRLGPPEKKYSTLDRELLGLYLAIRHFRALNIHPSCCWKIQVVAVCLSRAALSNGILGINYGAMAAEQAEDAEDHGLSSTVQRPCRFHRTLKAALKVRLQGPNWVDELPSVFLGLRTTPKEDIGFSAAERVYGTPLTVPEEFRDPTSKFRPFCTPNDLFYTKFKNSWPFATAHHKLSPPSVVPQSLRDAKFVFIRHDGHRGPSQRPYDGPFRLITSGDKTFRIMVGGREVYRLKPAHVDLTGPITVAQPPRRGRPPLQPAEPAPQEKTLELENTSARPESRSRRSGRTVRLPPRFH
ncbi:hypothetical protein RRG08_047337 [Elysia crispata]|uniref:Reverse transcriptase/retrotransposon-derived protein RNase H-like domain-containing protein n=1 Tax=Elysia crispata TaxID=231223 RepID=A0AAE1E7G4_9GAST|nr:hypothetical protein RRG08_047337 [Elysia crispata]